MDKLFSIEEINQLILVTKSAIETAYLCQLRDTMRENERLREFITQVANPPELIPDALDENDCCIMCGFSHKKMGAAAEEALSNKESAD